MNDPAAISIVADATPYRLMRHGHPALKNRAKVNRRSAAILVFDDEEKARQWLRRPNRALHQKTPIELLGADSTARLVETVLARIEHGVYSGYEL